MYYHLNRIRFYHQLLSAIKAEINEEELPRLVLDSAVITEQGDTTQSAPPQKLSATATGAKTYPSEKS